MGKKRTSNWTRRQFLAAAAAVSLQWFGVVAELSQYGDQFCPLSLEHAA